MIFAMKPGVVSWNKMIIRQIMLFCPKNTLEMNFERIFMTNFNWGALNPLNIILSPFLTTVPCFYDRFKPLYAFSKVAPESTHHVVNDSILVFEGGRNHIIGTTTFLITTFELQVTNFNKYKSWNPKVRLCIVIVLRCPLIGCWATERANKKAAQNNY